MIKYLQILNIYDPVAQWIEQDGSNVKVGGSNPSWVATYNFLQKFTWLRRLISKRNYYVSLSSMYYVYILKSSKNGSLYIGYTSDLKKRFAEHNNGLSISTKYKRPYKLIFYEAFLDRIDAKHREVYLKSGWGFRSINKLLKRSLEKKCD